MSTGTGERRVSLTSVPSRICMVRPILIRTCAASWRRHIHRMHADPNEVIEREGSVVIEVD